MESSRRHGVGSPGMGGPPSSPTDAKPEPDESTFEVAYVIRLPCGHLIDEPKDSVHVVCQGRIESLTPIAPGNSPPICGRKWHVWRKKGIELVAREE